MAQKTNRLADETSPYLRQHASNPVDWYPWGAAALQRARAEDKPIFLSIGYSACHWCHVMEHESFDDPAVAALMNEHFVCIKVDREERPDLDEIYMTAVQAMTGQGGWPMSVWLTPDLAPFYGGTYFPPEDSHGRPGFRRLLTHLAAAWRERRDECVKGSKELADHLTRVLQPQQLGGALPDGAGATMLEQSAERYDEVAGGFASAPHYAPKFPHASELMVLLRRAHRGQGKALMMATRTLDAMRDGGIHDQLGGGFHRYSTDREWLVPHFEKMLYDNALLAEAYLEGHLLTGDESYAATARDTLDYLLREMQGEHGGFYSSQDADSEGVEGKFFVWQLAQVQELLGADAALAAQRWGVTQDGNWEDTNVLWRAAPVAEVAAAHDLTSAEVEHRLEAARRTLLAARAGRVHPGTDDKVLAAWNGLAIAAMARGYQVLGDERYLTAARRAAEFVLGELVVDGRLRRSWHSGRAQHSGYLEDHAFVADALLTLFESDFDPRWLEAAGELLAQTVEHFRDDADGGFFFTADDHEELLTRSKSAVESSTPSGIARAARAFLRGGLLLGDQALRDVGRRALEANAAVLERSPIAVPSLVLALQFEQGDPREVIVAGAPDDPRTQALLRRARTAFPPDRVVAVVHDGNRDRLVARSPVFADKAPLDGVPAAYVCRLGACELPVTDPERLLR
ncbi:MAG: thioredoxin domain-containing protein [Planctomycetota bacterium]